MKFISICFVYCLSIFQIAISQPPSTGGFYEIADDILFNNEAFLFKGKVYLVNKNSNAIEIFNSTNASRTVAIKILSDEKLMTAKATDNYIYYAVIDNNNKYHIYRYDIENNVKRELTNKIIYQMSYEKRDDSRVVSNKNIQLETDKDKLFVQYYTYNLDKSTITSGSYNEYLVAFDTDNSLRSAATSTSAYYAKRLSNKSTYEGLNGGAIAYNKNVALFAWITDTEGNYSELKKGTYNASSQQYDDIKSYKISTNKTTIERVFEYKENLFAIAKIYDQSNTENASRFLFRYLESGKIEKVGALGNGEANDFLNAIVKNDDGFYIQSFDALYRYFSTQNSIKNIVPAVDKVNFSTSMYYTYNKNLFFYQWVSGGSKGVETMVYKSSEDKVIPFNEAIQNIEDGQGFEDPYYGWINANNCSYALRSVKGKYVAYKLDLVNKTSTPITPPEINKYSLEQVVAVKFIEPAKLILYKVEYKRKNKSEIKYFVYDCK